MSTPDDLAATVREGLSIGTRYMHSHSVLALAELVARCKDAEDGYMTATQRWVDEVCHYRNLAIAYGAKPDEMLSKWDRELAEKHTGGNVIDVAAAREETQELWQEAEAAEARVAVLEDALRRIAEWDCLNPPSSDLCADHPWLKRLVDAALGKEQT